MSNLFAYVLVFAGGGFGSLCRFAIGAAIQSWQPRFPWATLAANGLACLVLGLLTGLQLNQALSDQRRLLLATGFCGGFSTFSTFTGESWHLFESGQSAAALANIFLNLTVCFLCLLLGIKITG